jgi:hypothetical protein
VQAHHVELLHFGVTAETATLATVPERILAAAEAVGARPANRAPAFLALGRLAARAELPVYFAIAGSGGSGSKPFAVNHAFTLSIVSWLAWSAALVSA